MRKGNVKSSLKTKLKSKKHSFLCVCILIFFLHPLSVDPQIKTEICFFPYFELEMEFHLRLVPTSHRTSSRGYFPARSAPNSSFSSCNLDRISRRSSGWWPIPPGGEFPGFLRWDKVACLQGEKHEFHAFNVRHPSRIYDLGWSV
jgi:hypothetical protein